MASIIETKGLSACGCTNGLGQLDSGRFGLSPDMELIVGGMIRNGVEYAVGNPNATGEEIAGITVKKPFQWAGNDAEKPGRPDESIPATNIRYKEMAACIGTCAKAALEGHCVVIELAKPQ